MTTGQIDIEEWLAEARPRPRYEHLRRIDPATPLRADLTLGAETADKIRLGTGPPENALHEH
jgi:hypothetical protein